MGTLIKAGQPCEQCGSSDAKAIYDSNTYCFSCNYSSSKKTYAKFLTPNKFNGKLPNDCTPIPEGTPRLWFESVGIEKQHPPAHCISFSPSNNAIVIPHFYHNSLIGYHLRFMDARKPKAIAVGKQRLFFCCTGHNKDLVLCEDIRSSLKVACITDSACLFGTNVSEAELLLLPTLGYGIIYIWLDGDKAGKHGAKKIFDKLRLRTNVKIIESELDPKYYTKDEIREYLK